MSSEPEEQIFPDCAECAPCRCDDECDCNGGVCSMCGHWTDMTTNKVYIVFDREDYDTNTKKRERLAHEFKTWFMVTENGASIMGDRKREYFDLVDQLCGSETDKAKAPEKRGT